MDISFGKLDALIKDEDVVRIYADFNGIFVDSKRGGRSKTTVTFDSMEEIADLANSIGNHYGYSDWSKKVLLIKRNEEFWVHLVFPPFARKGVLINIIKENLKGEDIIALTI